MGVIFSQFTIPPPKHFLQASASPQSSLHLLQVNENGIIKKGESLRQLGLMRLYNSTSDMTLIAQGGRDWDEVKVGTRLESQLLN